MTWHAFPSRSTNVARGAPRLSASMPAAPLPAKRSRNGPSSAPDASSDANNASLTLSAKGRVPSGGASRRKPRAVPATMRPASGICVHLQDFSGPDPFEPAGHDLALQILIARIEPAVVIDDLLRDGPRSKRHELVGRLGQRCDS